MNGKRTSLLVSMIALLTFVSTALSCPHPVLREIDPEAYEAILQIYTERLTGELDADSTHEFDQISLSAQFDQFDLGNTFHAVVTLTVQLLEDVDYIRFDLADSEVQSVQIGTPLEDANYIYNSWFVDITLPEEIQVGDEFPVEIEYTGEIRNSNRFGGMVYQPDDDCLYTFGEPYQTRYWLACYDQPFDKLEAVEISVTLDPEYYVVSNGFLVSREPVGDQVRTTWRSEDPISTYLISIAANPYIEIDGGTAGENETPVHFWAYTNYEELAAWEFGRTGEMIELFESLFGAYPFNKYDQAMCPIFDGNGAMEHQTCTSYGDALVQAGNRTFEDVVAHELGHQWFGDYVSPLDFRHIWLNEGFATYLEVLWNEHLDYDQFQFKLFVDKVIYQAEDELIRYPIYDPPLNYLFGNAIYQKGALVLHMLRYVVGDEAFFAGVQQYLEDWAYGLVETEDLRFALEDVSGIDLQAFFDEWVYQAGWPVYNFNNFAVEPNENGATATIDIIQQQNNAPFFSTPLPFYLSNEAGEDTTVRLEVDPVIFQTVEFGQIDFVPDSWEFDPEHWILCDYTNNPPQPNISVNRMSHDFGEIQVGREAVWTLELRNSGDNPLTVHSVVSNNEVFHFPFFGQHILQPFEQVEIDVTFTPENLETYTGNLTISSNDPDTPSLRIRLTGRGSLHFVPVDPTGGSYRTVVLDALLDGVSLDPGDEIGIFDDDLCVGSVEVTGDWPRPLLAYEEDPENQLPGFRQGNPMSFRYWLAATGEEMDAEADYLEGFGDGLFGTLPFSQYTLSATSGLEILPLPLQGNYFELISTNLTPADLAIESIFHAVQDLVIVYQNDGAIYIPDYIDVIGDLDVTQGYQVYCSDDSEVLFRGDALDPATNYHLLANRWNWIGHPYRNQVQILDVVVPIEDVLVIMMLDDGHLLIPPFMDPFPLHPGEGMFIYVLEDITFQFPPEEEVVMMAPEARNERTLSLDNPAVTPTGLPYGVLVDHSAFSRSLDGFFLEVFDGSQMVGRKQIADGQQTVVTAWQGDVKHHLPGFTPGHPIRVRLVDAQGNAMATRQLSNETTFGAPPYARITLDPGETSLPQLFSVSAPWPNPFNPQTTIQLKLPKDGDVVFSFYNVLGEKVYSRNEFYKAGSYQESVSPLNGDNFAGSGVYFLNIRYQDHNVVYKTIYLR